jgi:2-oxoglutarate/2-oxoacid ferredoxin oxidoreductase subunit beta
LTFDTVGATPFGVFRSVERPSYDESVADQIVRAKQERGEGDLAALLTSGDTWHIG